MIPQAAGWATAAFLLLGVLAGASVLLLAGMLLVVMMRSRARRARRLAADAARPVLQKAIVEYLAGSNEVELIRRYLDRQRSDVGDALVMFQPTVAGSARERLCVLALDLRFVQDWCNEAESRDVVRRRTALSRLAFVCAHEPVRRIAGDLLLRATADPDEEVRLAAARALLQAGGEEEIEHVFSLAIGPNELTRVVLAEDLRRHAMELSSGPVPGVLRSGGLSKIRGTLEVLVAWERAIPLDDVREFLDHQDRAVRLLALRLVPLVPANSATRLALTRALQDPDREIRSLAIVAAGRLKMVEAIGELVRSMRHGDRELARQAAGALAVMPHGPATLQELSKSDDPQTARTASEALGRLRSGS